MNNIYNPLYIKTLFDNMSESYTRVNYITSFGFSLLWRKQLIDKLGKSKEKVQLIDIMTGMGETWSFIHKNFPNANYFALDLSTSMVNKSKKRSEEKYQNRFKIFRHNILENNLDSNSFDCISCGFGLKTFNKEQIELLAKEVFRILKPGGRFSFIEVSMPENKIVRSLYQFYLSRIIPLLGKLFLGNPHDYKMLWVYTQKFKNSKETHRIFEEQGLKVEYHKYFFGCATGISGHKF